jgi:hypothetical protein
MATLRAHGIAAPLPQGFEGRIFVRPRKGPGVPYPVAHFANFSLPDDVADFGGGAVNLMGPTDVFVVLFEYGPESLGRRLFARRGLPRSLSTDDFRPHLLRRGLTGQSGTQWFFTEADRPFTLYAVLGSHAQRQVLVPRVNALISQFDIAPPEATGLSADLAPAGGTATVTPSLSTAVGGRWN